MRYVEMVKRGMLVVGMLDNKDINSYKKKGYKLLLIEQLNGNKNGIRVKS